MFFIFYTPHFLLSSFSTLTLASLCGLWSSGINVINGSFSSINCWLHLGRIELSVIPANIWFSRKRVPTKITECSENQLFSSPQIFGSSCDLRYLLCHVFFLPAHGLQTHLQIKSRFSCFEEYNDDIPPSRIILAGRKKTFFGFSDW